MSLTAADKRVLRAEIVRRTHGHIGWVPRGASQFRQAGNSVCPPVAAAIIRAVLEQKAANDNKRARRPQLALRLEAA